MIGVKNDAPNGVKTGGSRRIDKVLSEGYLDGLGTLSLGEVRALRDEAAQEETDLSYLRRLLQGRGEIVHAELERRAGAVGELVDRLSTILADTTRSPSRGMGRYQRVEPSNTGALRRAEEQLASVDVSSIGVQSADDLDGLLGRLEETESLISARRRSVQEVHDAASAEITRRYRDGQADVADLLRDDDS